MAWANLLQYIYLGFCLVRSDCPSGWHSLALIGHNYSHNSSVSMRHACNNRSETWTLYTVPGEINHLLLSIETMETGSRAGAMVHWATENNMSLFHCKCYIMFHSSVGNIKLCSSCPDVALLPHTRALNEPSRRFHNPYIQGSYPCLLWHYAIKALRHAFKHSVLNVKVLVGAFN